MELQKKEITLNKSEFILHKIESELCAALDLNRSIVYENGRPKLLTISLINAVLEINDRLEVRARNVKSFYITGDYSEKQIEKYKDMLGDDLIHSEDLNCFKYYSNAQGANLVKHIDYEDLYELFKLISETEKEIKQCREKASSLTDYLNDII